MIYPVRPLAAPLWRMIHPARQREPFSGEGARLYGGRWNMKGRSALYLATDHVTAIAEYYQGVPKPGTLVPYRIDTSRIVDLTNREGGPADDPVADALSADWKTIAGIDSHVPPSWTLVQGLIAASADGALVPSIQNRAGRNLVLWHWHDASEAGEGAALTLLDPDSALAGL